MRIGKYTSPMDRSYWDGKRLDGKSSPGCHLKIQPPCATLHLAVENGKRANFWGKKTMSPYLGKQPENHVHLIYLPEYIYIYTFIDSDILHIYLIIFIMNHIYTSISTLAWDYRDLGGF